MGIPTYVVEEHHEAFLAWDHAQRSQWLPGSGVHLIHVDQHSDLSLPRLRAPIREALQTRQALVDFTYRELDIGSFILPAVYLGWFDRVQWVRNDPVTRLEAESWVVASHEGKGLELRSARAESEEGVSLTPDARSWLYSALTARGALFIDEAPIALDFCLDYFSCNRFPEGKHRVAVEATTVDEFNDNPYHFLRILPGSKVSSESSNGRHYLVFNDYPYESAGASRETEETIRARMEALFHLFSRSDFTPRAITISRSRYSGYTPEKHWRFIEDELLKALDQWRAIDLVPLEELGHGHHG